jgi:hypothetical protein
MSAKATNHTKRRTVAKHRGGKRKTTKRKARKVGRPKSTKRKTIKTKLANPLPADQLEGLIIEMASLLPGDILLFHSYAQKKPAKKISKVTESPYTHAAIYIGHGQLAEAVVPKIQIRSLTDADLKGQRIGVLRSQLGFADNRARRVRQFVEALVAQDAKYDFRGALSFQGAHKTFYEDILNEISKNYGKSKPATALSKRCYFCSALVVASYIAAEIIDGTAQVAYPPDVISPGDLHRDPAFGWFLGYLIEEGATIPDNDPLQFLTLWRDNQEVRWWL